MIVTMIMTMIMINNILYHIFRIHTDTAIFMVFHGLIFLFVSRFVMRIRFVMVRKTNHLNVAFHFNQSEKSLEANSSSFRYKHGTYERVGAVRTSE